MCWLQVLLEIGFVVWSSLHFNLHFFTFYLHVWKTWSKLNETSQKGTALRIPIGTAKNRFKKQRVPRRGKVHRAEENPEFLFFVCEDVGSFDVLCVFSSNQKDFSLVTQKLIDWHVYIHESGNFTILWMESFWKDVQLIVRGSRFCFQLRSPSCQVTCCGWWVWDDVQQRPMTSGWL